jgi:hypothetical protein
MPTCSLRSNGPGLPYLDVCGRRTAQKLRIPQHRKFQFSPKKIQNGKKVVSAEFDLP